MNNQEKARNIIERTVLGRQTTAPRTALAITQALADAGLLAPELPEPDLDHRDPAHRAEFEAWHEGPVLNVWYGGLPGEFTVQTFPDRSEVQMYEDGEPMNPLTPEEARRLAHTLLAAADRAEEEA